MPRATRPLSARHAVTGHAALPALYSGNVRSKPLVGRLRLIRSRCVFVESGWVGGSIVG